MQVETIGWRSGGPPKLLLRPLHSFVLSTNPRWAFQFAILSQNFGILEAASCLILIVCNQHSGFPGGKEATCQCRRQEARVRSLGGEDPLEEGMAPHSSILAWRIPMDRGAWGLQSVGSQRVRHDGVTKPRT